MSTEPRVGWRAALVLGPAVALACAGCSLPPLRGRAEVGTDPYGVFVADAQGGSDLYAVLADGGPPIQLTFSAVDERGPVLSPDGAMVAFLRVQRGVSARDPERRTVWVLNLLSGVDRELALPAGAPPAARVGWSRDGHHVYVRAGDAIYRVTPPPANGAASLVVPPERAVADSSFYVLLGEPAFARAVGCDSGLCTVGPDGVASPLAQGASGAVRWGRDSVGYFTGEGFNVRPLGPGRIRLLGWRPEPDHPREMTFFPGRPRPLDAS